MNDDSEATRQERRERKLEKKKERVQKHGRNLAHIYKEAIHPGPGVAILLGQRAYNRAAPSPLTP